MFCHIQPKMGHLQPSRPMHFGCGGHIQSKMADLQPSSHDCATRPRAAASKPAVVPVNCLGHRAVPVHANASAFLQGSGARPSKAELKKAKKAANAKAKAEVAAAMKELDEQRIVRVPVLDVDSDIEEAEGGGRECSASATRTDNKRFRVEWWIRSV